MTASFKKILITGGAGFIGSNFVRYILRQPAEKGRRPSVINLDKLTYSGNPENLRDAERDPRYKFVKGDICDKRLVAKLIKGCDAVINFAAESHVDRSIKYPDEFLKTNVFGTQVLLDCARTHKIKRFIQISTDEVYGSIEKGTFNENSTVAPNSPYAASKAAADLLARSYFITYGLPVIITRSSNNFGPYQYPEKIMPLFITNALYDRKLPVYADGKNVREWIYVLDNCEAINYVLRHGKNGEVYNIGSGNEMKNIDLTLKILDILGKERSLIEFVKDRPGHDKRYALDNRKIIRLGWKRKYRFEDALKATVLWYKENVKWWKRLKERKEEKFW
ncbi:MAG: dTDP-glucose 4,6-dehydratase [Candidatus Omnitrophica bacterium]|nr:dTDP-glucose 4,6-dehydratase [Candidatus Omnitrophota bacterium]